MLGRDKVAAAMRAIEAELAGGPRAELALDVLQLADLLRRRAERLLPKEEPERELLAAFPDAAGILAVTGAVRVANTALDGLAPGGRAVGRTPLEITRSEELAEAARRALQGHTKRLELELPPGPRPHVATLTPLLRGEVLLLLRDVTEARRAEQARRDFVANASHELRTPVAAIHGAAETLLLGALQDPQAARQFAEMIARQAERLARLTRDLLDLSRIESGQWTMQLGPVEVEGALRAAGDAVALPAREKGVELRRQEAGGLRVVADTRALEHVLVNLLDNAVKYTPQGGTVTLSGAAEGDRVVLSVADTGPGIERQHLVRLFERFYRADPGRSREQGGTGIGLSLVKHLVQAQKGEVGVESGPQGSRFWVRLPAAP
ncbi:MAG: PAS domain-containing protein [Deltaproteobacteria bacterium]|nr:PAS domain-containing protein [Deltaproteobacteria bacterium]